MRFKWVALVALVLLALLIVFAPLRYEFIVPIEPIWFRWILGASLTLVIPLGILSVALFAFNNKLKDESGSRTTDLEMVNEKLQKEIFRRNEVEEILSREVEFNIAIADLSVQLVSPASIDDISVLVLEQAKRLTGSTLGYVGYMDPQSGHMVCPALSSGMWEDCKVSDQSVFYNKQGGLWGWVPENRKSLLTNDASTDARSKGIPSGHIPIRQFLSAPALIGEMLVGQLSVANSQRDYNERDLAQIERLAALYAIAVQRKRTEEERLRLEKAIEQAMESVTITDTAGTILYVNPAFERISGYSRKEAIGCNLRILKSGKHDKAFYTTLWNTITRGEIWTGRFTNKKKDGSLYEAEATISPIRDQTGKITHYVSVKRDVTEEIQMQKQLRQAQKMEAIGTLAGGIAHDFNNILGAILGYTELAQYDLPEGHPAHARMREVLKAGNRAKDLVRQILAFSRQKEQESKPVHVSPIIKEVLKLLRASLPTTIEIRQSIDAGSDIVLTDPIQIHQVMMNLCTNAAHAMSQKGGILEVTLTSEVYKPESQQTAITDGNQGPKIFSTSATPHSDLSPGSYLRLTVRDTGEGMKSCVLERIFDPYFTTKAPGEGTGLGLAVVHGIVKNCGGAITVSSEPGAGSTFHVFLPLIKEAVPSERKTMALPPMGSERILLVDDEEILAAMGQQMLERLGYTVTARTSSVEALALFRNRPDQFDLVITDKTMPNMTGFDLAKEFLHIRPDIPVILCTGFSEVDAAEKARAIGIREVVMKPIVMRQIAETIRKVLE